ncbi:MAG TPA: succinate dehydrogenase cytochrome b subunit [Ferruginibacter sp.]|nr:succinate dehydrogenase cytochrome b subunit [Chitinophagaceae bacterium]MBK9530653.1 succinate dehydrogenase cytochrome b subunit [Chitinophagaceae bacterium]HQW93812.1 succinate dehydrogenase cytochrome b subunit [Ferruginibacter sp.]
MTWKHFFTSSIGKKIIMGLTGLFLITFLVIHVGVNSCIFLNDGGETFNTVAHFMSHNWILRFLEIGLFAALILHIVQGLVVWKQNSSARPVKYAVNAPGANSKWYSRSMGLLGTLLLFFLIIHVSKFFLDTKIALYADGGAHDASHNLYAEMKAEFQKWWVVVIYIIGVISLFWHLIHGFQSAFQTLGINHKRYTPLIKMIGIGYSVIVCLLFALMPVAFYAGWIN